MPGRTCLVVVVALCAGCTGEDPWEPAPCTPGETIRCTCDDGWGGRQRCAEALALGVARRLGQRA